MARDTGRARSKPRVRPKVRQRSAPGGRGASRGRGASGGIWRFVRRLVVILVLVAVVVPPASVLVYRSVPPPITILMITRLIQGHGMDYQWRSLGDMSPALPRAAVASEDARFCSHHGFDFTAMEKAMRNNERRPGRIRGGSTISQQTAKNVFLWPGRDYVRKGIEAWYTVPGVYGAEAASQRYFHEPASRLSAAQAARLIAVLPKPLSWDVGDPGRYVVRRTGHIDRAMGTIRIDGLADCVGR
jgi:monofunctional biosynthetic peptidoglycan transglycosylase